MNETISITRGAGGGGTIVTVTRKENGVTAKYSYKSSAMKIAESVEFARKGAQDMLDQVKAAK